MRIFIGVFVIALSLDVYAGALQQIFKKAAPAVGEKGMQSKANIWFAFERAKPEYKFSTSSKKMGVLKSSDGGRTGEVEVWSEETAAGGEAFSFLVPETKDLPKRTRLFDEKTHVAVERVYGSLQGDVKKIEGFDVKKIDGISYRQKQSLEIDTLKENRRFVRSGPDILVSIKPKEAGQRLTARLNAADLSGEILDFDFVQPNLVVVRTVKNSAITEHTLAMAQVKGKSSMQVQKIASFEPPPRTLRGLFAKKQNFLKNEPIPDRKDVPLNSELAGAK